jgi:hypothetical protein
LRSDQLFVASELACAIVASAVSAPVFRRPIRPTGSLPRATDKGVVMSAWYPGWQVAAAWLLTVAVAATIYFIPMKGLVDIMSPAEITADAE